jgi:hypothetical protein
MNRRNQYRISIEELLRRERRTLLEIAHATICNGETAPALCIHECRVEIDDSCEHGCPSVLKALMIRGHRWNEIFGEPM